MKSFEEAWEFTDKIPGSFTRLNGEMLYRYALDCHDLMVEVGVDQGRSASLLLAAAEQTGATVVLVDSWESCLIENRDKVKSLLRNFPRAIALIRNEKSTDAAVHYAERIIGLLHIDANHYDDNPGNDCEAWLPKVKGGGVVCFHDFEATFPAVTEAVNKYTEGWTNLGNYDSLAIRRKL